MDYSAVVIPVTKADKTIDVPDPDYKPLNDTDAKYWDACQYGLSISNTRVNHCQMTRRYTMVLRWAFRLWPGSLKRRRYGL